jgi:hypothetical protein
MLAAVIPTAQEQYLVELINRARADPAAEASRSGISLNEGLSPGTISTAAKQPLAINPNLTDAASKHSQWMIDNDTFAHNEGATTPGQRMAAAGYSFSGSWSNGENIGWRGQYPNTPELNSTVAQMHKDLFVDADVSGRGHRLNMMSNSFREIGAGALAGDFRSGGTNYHSVLVTEDFASNSANAAGDSFLTGVAFSDTTLHDSFYTPGEGVGGMTITAVRASDSASFSTTTWSSGGYSLRLHPGTYTVTATSASFATVTYSNVIIGSTNVKRDFIPSADTTAPTASGGAFLSDTAPQRIRMKFSESVAATLFSADLKIQSTDGGSLIPAVLADYDDATNVATFKISSLLSDGTYRATILAGAVADAAGNALAAEYGFTFSVLGGDANRDGAVDSVDFALLAAHFGETNAMYGSGDFNYDGVVSSVDSDLLIAGFGKRLGAGASASVLPAARRDGGKMQRGADIEEYILLI